MTRESKRPHRPPAVSIVVLIFLAQVALYLVLLGLQLAGIGAGRIRTLGSGVTAAALAGDHWIDLALFAGLLLLLAASLVVTVGLARLRPWAWLWGMTIQGLRLLIGLISYFRGDPYAFSMIVPLIAVVLLDQAPVRRAFGQDGSGHA